MWGPFTIDRFANHNNAKVTRFNSKYFVPGTEAIDAFTQDWSLENNLLVPPTKLILRTLRYIENSKVKVFSSFLIGRLHHFGPSFK